VALAKVLAERNIPVTVAASDPASCDLGSLDAELKKQVSVVSGSKFTELLDSASASGQSYTLIFNAWYPDPNRDSPETLGCYPQKLLSESLAAQGSLAAAHPSAAIINFAFLPAIYVGTALEDHVASLRGGITGVTRTLARKFGRQGIRVTCVQAGLADLPETQQWVSDIVKKVQVPVKRWANAQEIAKFMVFLGVDSLYTTGQTMIIDGGLTAGITGT
jgi:hypothetical protein